MSTPSNSKLMLTGAGYNPVIGPGSTADSTNSLPKQTASQRSVSQLSSPSSLLRLASTSSERKLNSFGAHASIYDRNLHRGMHEISLSSMSFLFMEVIRMSLNGSESLLQMERKLNNLGYRVGLRLLELVSLRENFNNNLASSGKSNTAQRHVRVLEILQFVKESIWPCIFGKEADNLEKSVQNENQYMIIDSDPILSRYICVPKEYEGLDCESFVAGIVEGLLDISYFRCEVTAHSAPLEGHPNRTVYLVDFDSSIISREERLSKK